MPKYTHRWRKHSKRSRKPSKRSAKRSSGFRKRVTKKTHCWPKPNIATVKETVDSGTLAIEQESSAQATVYTTEAAFFTRVNAVAENYRFYRIKRITYEYEIPHNLYVDGSGSQVYMYSVPLRNGNYDYTTAGSATLQTTTPLASLLEMGAKPRKANGVVKISYVPNIVIATPIIDYAGQVEGSTTSATTIPVASAQYYTMIKKSPWLSTQVLNSLIVQPGTPQFPMNGLDARHWGHAVCFAQSVLDNTTVSIPVKITIEVDFKGPKNIPK